jgi:hypothetical protein
MPTAVLDVAKSPEALNVAAAEVKARRGGRPDPPIPASGTAVHVAEDGCVHAAALRTPGARRTAPSAGIP